MYVKYNVSINNNTILQVTLSILWCWLSFHSQPNHPQFFKQLQADLENSHPPYPPAHLSPQHRDSPGHGHKAPSNHCLVKTDWRIAAVHHISSYFITSLQYFFWKPRTDATCCFPNGKQKLKQVTFKGKEILSTAYPSLHLATNHPTRVQCQAFILSSACWVNRKHLSEPAGSQLRRQKNTFCTTI